jgi:hypothetical protein
MTEAAARSIRATTRSTHLAWSSALILSAALPLVAALFAPRMSAEPLRAAAFTFLGGALTGLAPLALAARAGLSTRAAVSVAGAALLALAAAALAGPMGLVTLVVVDAALVALAWAVGGSIGRRVGHPGHLLAACLVAAAADLASVVHPQGPTHAIVKSERALSLLAISFPVPSTHAFAPVLGVGDLLFAALALGVAAQHRLSVLRMAALIALGVLVAGLAAALFETAVPALIPMAAAIAMGLPAARRLQPQDRRTTQLAAAVAGAVVLGVLLTRWVGP